MKIIDISVVIHTTMAVWPGDPKVGNYLESSINVGNEACNFWKENFFLMVKCHQFLKLSI